MQNTNVKEQLYGLNYLRYGLGLYIVIYHTMHYEVIPQWINKITGMGFFATSSFFILSGFILTYVYLSNHGTEDVKMKESGKSFLIKRLANLYPIHIFSLILTFIVLTILPLFFSEYIDSTYNIRYVMFDSNNYTPIDALKHWMSNSEMIVALLMNVTLLHSLNPYYLTFNAPAWSISTLFFMYILFPYIAPKIDRIRRPGMSILIVNIFYILIPIIFICLSLYDKPYTGILNRNPLVRLPEFISGILLCNFYFKMKRNNFVFNNKHRLYMVIFLIISLTSASWLLHNPDIISKKGNASYYLLHDGLLLIPGCILVLLFATLNVKYSSKWDRLGNASLPLFALHIPCYTLFVVLQKSVFNGHIYFAFYPVFLIFITFLCVSFQEKLVSSTRKFIISRLLKK